MFQIRKEQINEFELKQTESFIQRMITHLKEHFPEDTERLLEDWLRQFVEDEIETAHRFEIYNEDDVAVCIISIFAVNPDGNNEPKWVKEVQADPNLTSVQKAERLNQWVEQELEDQSKDD